MLVYVLYINIVRIRMCWIFGICLCNSRKLDLSWWQVCAYGRQIGSGNVWSFHCCRHAVIDLIFLEWMHATWTFWDCPFLFYSSWYRLIVQGCKWIWLVSVTAAKKIDCTCILSLEYFQKGFVKIGIAELNEGHGWDKKVWFYSL